MSTRSEREVGDNQAATLDPRDERRLRARLNDWSRFLRGVGVEDFDDVYQDAWCKLLETERKGRPTRNREAALRWALANSWLEELRRRRRRPTVALDQAPALVAPEAADPGHHAELLEAARCVFEAVHELSRRQRQIVLLADVFGLRPRDVQERLSISERTYQRDHAGALRAVGARLELLEDDGLVAEPEAATA
jgi:RNA polymerase sigma factor (sigma-70 family)